MNQLPLTSDGAPKALGCVEIWVTCTSEDADVAFMSAVVKAGASFRTIETTQDRDLLKYPRRNETDAVQSCALTSVIEAQIISFISGKPMTAITKVHAREILDSRGNPTLEAEVTLSSGRMGCAAESRPAPPPARARRWSCATATRRATSAGRDARGVQRQHHHCGGPAGFADAADQKGLDARLIALDGSPNKNHLGANALLGVSLANARTRWRPRRACRCGSISPAIAAVLPVPMMNIINGGAHADNNVDMQEFMVLPVGRASPRRCAAAPRSSTR